MDIHTEALEEILQIYGIEVPIDVVGQIASDFSDHISAYNDTMSTPHIGGKSECHSCKAKDERIKELEKENHIYSENVKKRHGAVRAYVDSNTGSVLFDMV